PGAFDLLLVDEVHEFKARGSAQGIAMGQLAEAIGRVLTCTGTLTGGYASTLFSLLWRVDREFRQEFAYHEEERFINRYGVVERQYREEGGEDGAEYGRMSKRRLVLTRVRERPGLAPAILFKLIHNTVFLRLRDVSRDLPPYREHILRVPLDTRPSPTGIVGADGEELLLPSQRDAYRRLADTLRERVTAALRAKGKSKLLGAYLQALLAYPDRCTAGEVVLDKDTGAIVAEAPAQPEERTYPKEQALIELALRERERGRRVLAFVTHTDTRDVTPRLRRVLEGVGLRVAVLKAQTTKPDLREEWVARQVAAGIDVLIAPPKCVQTGLDLLAFATIVWAQPEYSVYTLRQASRRSWRIAQAQPVDVYYLVYAETMQAEALSLVGKKLRAAMLVEGELPQEGLATDELGDSDLLLALAKRLAAGESAEVESLEALFAESLALEEGAGRAIDGFAWEEAEWGSPQATSPVADTAAFPAAGPGAALQPTLFDALPAGAAAIVTHPALHAAQGDETATPSGPTPVTDGGASAAPGSPAAFVPSVGQIVTLDSLAALATSRRTRGRKAPAKDQLSLFG
ncbi:MAG: DNA ligase, partial [uncultured Thermomicrobiales bacterium]